MQFVRILVSLLAPTLAVVISTGCGQKGALYLPKGEAARQRATLPQAIIRPAGRPTPPQNPASTPVEEPTPVPQQPLVPVDSPS